MQTLYDLVFIFFSFLYFPYFILNRKYHREFIQRLGIFSRNSFDKIRRHKIIWIHAVSVGEVNSALPLWKLLRQNFPQYRIVFSTITKTGNNLAKKFAQPDEFVVYFPLDFSFIVRRVVKLIHPHLVIILETELWPNFIAQCNKIDIPVILGNARLSDSSFIRYKLGSPFLSPVLDKINLILAQTEKDADRLISLGASKNKVWVSGNMKFDNIDCSDKRIDYSDRLRLLLELSNQDKLLVAGSTHPGEEEILLAIYKELLMQFPNLRLLIAPRHIERIPQIEKLVSSYGLSPFRISRLFNPASSIQHPVSGVFLLDTIGQLRDFYAIADIVFVGGSLVKRGGHNIIEPAMFSKPVISGNYFFNFSDIFKVFRDSQAVITCQNKEGLKSAISELLNNPVQAKILGERAREVILKQQGATQKNLEWVSKYLDRNPTF